MLTQKTISNECSISGKGFICNQEVQVVLKPASPGSGIRFIRTDLEGSPAVMARPSSQIPGEQCTALQDRGAKVVVVEHLLAACSALGVSNLEVWLNGMELPTLDGSALPWAELMLSAGIRDSSMLYREAVLRKPISVNAADGSFILALPADEFSLEYLLSYDHSPEIGSSYISLRPDAEDMLKLLLPARTFIMEGEALAALNSGKIRSTDVNLGLVIREGQTPSLRLPCELARHKVLDMLGDLFILGKRVRGRFIGVKSGHKLNAQMVRELAARFPG